MRELEFQGKCFCFTGGMAELKRIAAERETRARGGLTSKVVNPQLDYLVVGSIPSSGWKHGNFGRKIERAQSLILEGSSDLQLVPESVYMEALAMHPTVGSGDCDSKMAVFTYKFTAPDRNSFDRRGLEKAVAELRERLDFHVRISSFYVDNHQALFHDDALNKVPNSYLIFELRFVKQLELDRSTTSLATAIEAKIDPLLGIDGDLRWFESIAGTADFVRLIRELPEETQVPDAG